MINFTDSFKKKIVVIVFVAVFFSLIWPFTSFNLHIGNTDLTINPADGLPVLLGFMFGSSGAIGCALGAVGPELFDGTLSPATIGTALGYFCLAYAPYKVWAVILKKEDENIFLVKKPGDVLAYVITGIMGSLLCSLPVALANDVWYQEAAFSAAYLISVVQVLISVLTFGLGVASETGLLQTLIHHSMHNIPRKYVTLAVVFISLMSHIASDAAIVIMPPLAAMLFYSMGRHPLVGFACSLAAIYSGFTANILIVTTDVLLSGITTQAIRTIDATMTVTPIDNWYFMSFAVFYLTAVTTFITEKFVEPRMGVYDPAHAQENLTIPDVSPEEKKALRHTLIAAVLYLAVVFLMTFPDNGLLRNSQTHSLLGSPLLRGVIPLLCGFLLTVGLTYGVSIRKIKNADDMIHCMTNAVKGLSGFLVMAFFIAQFIAAFAWTNMSTMIAMKGALFLKDVGISLHPAAPPYGPCCRRSSSPCSCSWAITRPSSRPPSGPATAR